MGQFGTELRKERESRGIPLESITNSTKISSRHLSALEEDRFDRLPGGVFNKGIVRGYARVVGLDEEAWVDRFMSAYQNSGQLKDDDTEWIKFAEGIVKAREAERPKAPPRLKWAGVILFVILLAGFGWYVYRYVQGKVSASDGSHSSIILPNQQEKAFGDALYHLAGAATGIVKTARIA